MNSRKELLLSWSRAFESKEKGVFFESCKLNWRGKLSLCWSSSIPSGFIWGTPRPLIHALLLLYSHASTSSFTSVSSQLILKKRTFLAFEWMQSLLPRWSMMLGSIFPFNALFCKSKPPSKRNTIKRLKANFCVLVTKRRKAPLSRLRTTRK